MADLMLTDDNFEAEALKSEIPVLVDFYADWCGPCQMASPIVENLAKSFAGRLKVAKVNIDTSPQIAANLGVMSIPTFVVFKDGKEQERLVGFPGEDGLRNLIGKVI